jgi:multidrug efflux system outer membrane protein
MSAPVKILALAVAALMSGCSMIPTYVRPEIGVPGQWPTAVSTPSAPVVAMQDWASYFPDPRLQGLIKAALSNNRDLRVAMLNIELTRAQYQIQRADQFPTLNASINATRQPATAAPHAVSTSATGGLAVSAFELDLWGRVASLSQAAAAQVLASEASQQVVQISLVASVATGYYSLWADRWQLALTEQTLRLREASLGLLKLKYDNGVLNELDWRSAQSLAEAARVSRAQWQRQWQLDLNALSLLVGQSVGSDQWPPMPVVPQRPVDDVDAIVALGSDAQALWPRLSELPVGLPSDVLLKRPDITQAEQQLISANANIGAARAARFPRISLTGSGGVASDSLSGLFSDGRSAWSVGGSLLAPILDAGRTQAGVTVAEVRRDVAVAQYDKALQVAFREVADALVTRSTYADQAKAQQAQAAAEADRLRLSALRYKNGVASQLDLLDAQRSLFAAQQAWISTEQARQQAHIAVFKALGGGLR